MQAHDPRASSTLSVYFRLLGYVRPYVGLFAVSIGGYGVFASSQPMLAAVLKYFVDGLIDPGGAEILGLRMMHAVPLMIVLIAVWQGLGAYFGGYFMARMSLGIVRDLRQALFDSLLRLPNPAPMAVFITWTLLSGRARTSARCALRKKGNWVEDHTLSLPSGVYSATD